MFETYTATDQRIHQLSQIIAKANRTYVTKSADHSHTNLAFDAIGCRMFGRWIDGHQRIVLTLNLKAFEFEWLSSAEEVLFAYPIEGQTLSQIERRMEQDLTALGLNPAGFRDALHFEITSYPFKDKPFERLSPQAIDHWAGYRQLANQAGHLLMDHLQVFSELRIWPHHFDTAIYIKPVESLGLGFGLAMEDSLLGEPYFYYSAYGLKGRTVNYSAQSSLQTGQWLISESWCGAVLPLSALSSEQDLEMVRAFILEVSTRYMGMTGMGTQSKVA